MGSESDLAVVALALVIASVFVSLWLPETERGVS